MNVVMDELSFAAYIVLFKKSLLWKIFIAVFVCLGIFWALFSAIHAKDLFRWWIWLIISGLFAIGIELWKMIQLTGMCLDIDRRSNCWRIFRAYRRYYWIIPNFFPNSLVLVGAWFLGIAIINVDVLFETLEGNYPMTWAIRFINYFFWCGTIILWTYHISTYMKMDTQYLEKKLGYRNFIVILVVAGLCGATIPIGFFVGVYVGAWIGLISSEGKDKDSIAAFVVITVLLFFILGLWIFIRCYLRGKRKKLEKEGKGKKAAETNQSFDSSRNIIRLEQKEEEIKHTTEIEKQSHGEKQNAVDHSLTVEEIHTKDDKANKA